MKAKYCVKVLFLWMFLLPLYSLGAPQTDYPFSCVSLSFLLCGIRYRLTLVSASFFGASRFLLPSRYYLLIISTEGFPAWLGAYYFTLGTPTSG